MGACVCVFDTTITVLYAQIKALLDEEVSRREEGERNMMSMIEDAFVRIAKQIDEERVDREATQEMMLKLMEETCVSVEKHLHM